MDYTRWLLFIIFALMVIYLSYAFVFNVSWVDKLLHPPHYLDEFHDAGKINSQEKFIEIATRVESSDDKKAEIALLKEEFGISH